MKLSESKSASKETFNTFGQFYFRFIASALLSIFVSVHGF